METVFCILHEEMVELEQKFCTGHAYVVYEDREVGLSSLDFHCMTLSDYAFSPPPPALFSEELDERGADEWAWWCEEFEPSSNEVFISNLKAYELKADFEGAL